MAEARRLLRLIGVAAAALATAGIAGTATAAADDVTPMIIGGEETTIEENPFAVALTTPDGFQFCGGTIVAPNKVLTAAHCTEGSSPADIQVVAGQTSLSAGGGTTAGVTDIWIHPAWNSSALQNDASVLTLDASLTETPIAIAGPDDSALYAEGANSTVLGWGTTESGSTSDTLRKVDVPVVSDAACTESYADQYDAASMVCAGLAEGGKDSCQGDSGGPLVGVAADGTRKLIGIVSWGQGCAEPGYYGVYGRVSAFYDELSGQIG
ncbi:S1 family peptidase [Actinophytocola algeriensis]|jgi:secreted trypsin-like serine protease|uniref:Secreted trypsin-like serine protease n=1 Tax=Actinophytocola algeriensis TaxID=1768010 RepID=A0A7W7QBD4_9PSEU|nr:serine protease [Actinophytocola algeriensis]MBB4910462.1 secreted trypsin-like serine protease [Actinophytocola algeriensis]MBE1480549.1 secreted trypsin-like serine protease [Actinophytocola algeriensis]